MDYKVLLTNYYTVIKVTSVYKHKLFYRNLWDSDHYGVVISGMRLKKAQDVIFKWEWNGNKKDEILS